MTAALMEVVPVSYEDLFAFLVAGAILVVAVLALGWIEKLVARRSARARPRSAQPMPQPFVAPTDTAV
jgi:hypothetical protein